MAAASFALAQAPSIKIDFLKETESITGSGSYFYLENSPEAAAEIFSYAAVNDLGTIKLNGKIEKLKLISQKILNKGKGRRALGREIQETWSNQDVSVRIKYKVSKLQEEGHDLTGEMSVTKKTAILKVKIRGYWGS